MAFFSDQKNESMAQQGSSPISDQINMIGEGTVLEGTLRAESDVRVSGRIVGQLDVQGKAIIAQEGTIEGEITATNADVAGRVQGEIRVEERLVLKSTARVDGDIMTERIVVEEGARFTGECKMGEDARVASHRTDERESASWSEAATGAVPAEDGGAAEVLEPSSEEDAASDEQEEVTT